MSGDGVPEAGPERGGGGRQGRARPVTRRIRGGPAGRRGKAGKGRSAAPRGSVWPRVEAAVPGQRWVQAPQPPQHRGGVWRRTEKADKKAKMKVKNQRKRALGVKGGAGAPAGPGGRRGPSAVRAGKGVREVGVSFRSQRSGS